MSGEHPAAALVGDVAGAIAAFVRTLDQLPAEPRWVLVGGFAVNLRVAALHRITADLPVARPCRVGGHPNHRHPRLLRRRQRGQRPGVAGVAEGVDRAALPDQPVALGVGCRHDPHDRTARCCRQLAIAGAGVTTGVDLAGAVGDPVAAVVMRRGHPHRGRRHRRAALRRLHPRREPTRPATTATTTTTTTTTTTGRADRRGEHCHGHIGPGRRLRWRQPAGEEGVDDGPAA